jgi:hypothetical protein
MPIPKPNADEKQSEYIQTMCGSNRKRVHRQRPSRSSLLHTMERGQVALFFMQRKTNFKQMTCFILC